jgi:hypothetical protein
MAMIQVVLHEGKSFTLPVENYDPIEMTALINNNALTVVCISNIIIHRTSIKMIYPVTIPEPEPTE